MNERCVRQSQQCAEARKKKHQKHEKKRKHDRAGRAFSFAHIYGSNYSCLKQAFQLINRAVSWSIISTAKHAGEIKFTLNQIL